MVALWDTRAAAPRDPGYGDGFVEAFQQQQQSTRIQAASRRAGLLRCTAAPRGVGYASSPPGRGRQGGARDVRSQGARGPGPPRSTHPRRRPTARAPRAPRRACARRARTASTGSSRFLPGAARGAPRRARAAARSRCPPDVVVRRARRLATESGRRQRFDAPPPCIARRSRSSSGASSRCSAHFSKRSRLRPAGTLRWGRGGAGGAGAGDANGLALGGVRGRPSSGLRADARTSTVSGRRFCRTSRVASSPQTARACST